MTWPDLADLPFARILEPHDGEVVSGGEYDCVLFDGLTFDDPEAPNSHFLECAFHHVTVSKGKLSRCRLRDVWLRDVRLTGTNLAESSWLDITVLGSSLAGIQVFGAELRRVAFRGCKLDSVNFRASKLTEVTFDNCILRDADFGGATLTRCSFPGSDLTRVDFSKVTLDQTDLRGAQLGLIIDPGSLRGGIITSGQLAVVAPVLAQTLGIVVNDEQA